MSNEFVLPVKELPESLRSALASVGYGRPDIKIIVSEREQIASAYGDGYRAFAIGVNVSTGERKQHTGSWGGANPFSSTVVDAQPSIDLPPGMALIMGQEGGGRPVYATITVGPGTLNPALLPATSDVTERERSILAIFGGIKGGHREGYLRRFKVEPAEIASLIARGYLTRNKAGAMSITTKGKNARGRTQVPC